MIPHSTLHLVQKIKAYKNTLDQKFPINEWRT